MREVSVTKLLGVKLQSDLKWGENTNYICNRASAKLWLIRRMKSIGLEPEVIIDFYTREIRSLLELAVPVWHSGLTVQQSDQIEAVQKMAVSLILNDFKSSYFVKCTLLNIEPLYLRRLTLCEHFVTRTANSKQHSNLFQPKEKCYNTRSEPNTFIEHQCNSSRHFNSPLSFLTRTLNKIIREKKK